jgi:hypothetical protein
MTDDLKDLFERSLAERPPLPPAPQMLARARAADRRRSAYLTTGSGVAAVAAIAAVAVVVPRLSGPGGERVGSPPNSPPSAGAASASPMPLPSTPSASDPVPPGKAGVPMSHGRNLMNELLARVPSKYAATSLVNYADAPATFDPTRNEGADPYAINAIAVVRITTQGNGGHAHRVHRPGQEAGPGRRPVCAGGGDQGRRPAWTCGVITIGGRNIRVTTATYPYSGRSISATLFLGDGWLTVTEHLGAILPPDFTDPLPPDANPPAMAGNDPGAAPRNPALTDLPFTAPQLAEICAAPVMVPSNLTRCSSRWASIVWWAAHPSGNRTGSFRCTGSVDGCSSSRSRMPARATTTHACRWRDASTHSRPASRWNAVASRRPDSGCRNTVTSYSRPCRRFAVSTSTGTSPRAARSAATWSGARRRRRSGPASTGVHHLRIARARGAPPAAG